MNRREAAKQFANEVVELFNATVDAVVATELNDRWVKISEGIEGSTAVRARVHRKRAPKPCVVPHCRNTGAPRYGFTCVEHSGQYNKEERDELREKAKQPGGKWNHKMPKAAKKVVRRKHKAKAGKTE